MTDRISISQIKLGLENQRKTDTHYYRLEHDPEYAAKYDRQMQEYEDFCKRFGYPD